MNLNRVAVLGTCCLSLLMTSVVTGQNNNRDAQKRRARLLADQYQRNALQNQAGIRQLDQRIKQAETVVRAAPAEIKKRESKVDSATETSNTEKSKVSAARLKAGQTTKTVTETRKRLLMEFLSSKTIVQLTSGIREIELKLENMKIDLLEPLQKTVSYIALDKQMSAARQKKSVLTGAVERDQQEVIRILDKILLLETRIRDLERTILDKDADYVKLEKELAELRKELSELRVLFNKTLSDQPEVSSALDEAKAARIEMVAASKSMTLASRDLAKSKSSLRQAKGALASAKANGSSLVRQRSSLQATMKRNQQLASRYRSQSR